MSKRTYVVTAATGRVGQRVARGLLQAGHRVRVVGRDATRLAPLVALGADPHVGSVEDLHFVERVFDGADAAELVVSGDHDAHDFRRSFADVGENYAKAARKTGLRSAVFISTIGTHDEKNRGLILIHTDVERHLDAVDGLNVLHLRAPAFFENLFYFVPRSRARGALSSGIDVDVDMDMASTADVAAVALRHLIELDFEGKSSLELHGREVLTMRKIAALVSKELGRPFDAERVEREADIDAMLAAGMKRDFSTLMRDTWDTFSRYGLLRAPAPRAISATTPMEEFVRSQLVPALTKPA